MGLTTGTIQPSTSQSPNDKAPTVDTIHIDLWKFFEERGSKLKDSMFSVVTWIVTFAAAVMGFAVNKGLQQGLMQVTNPELVAVLGAIGLLIVHHARLVIHDYGEHINRTFKRADTARMGEKNPQTIWDAGEAAANEPPPQACRPLLNVLDLFTDGFLLLILTGIATTFPISSSWDPFIILGFIILLIVRRARIFNPRNLRGRQRTPPARAN